MGIPKFYRWLSERYPLINQVVKGSLRPEFDNLYLDMNGIIHMCSHPRDGVDATKEQMTEEEMYASIFEYIDRIFHLISPKKLLFMAVDGVAPRAKMNQQRQRRFKSAKEAEEAIEKAQAEGHKVSKKDVFDSNCITPGTEFMARLCKHLRYFVRKKMQEDSSWRRVQVILSGPDIPGEGEHKIMMYIRGIKALGGFPPNLRHCMYGLDADLIMLGLVTHEPHFALLREEVIFGRPKKQLGFSRKAVGKKDEFQLLHLSLLRQYLDMEFRNALFKPPRPSGGNGGAGVAGEGKSRPAFDPSKYDLEKIVDDFVVMCMLVGNDFIPNVPMLDIAEDGLDRMLDGYKNDVLPIHGYMLENGKLCEKPYAAFLRVVADITQSIWQARVRNNFEDPHARRSRHFTRPPELTSDELKRTKAESKAIDAQQGGGLSGKTHRFASKENMAYYKLKFRDFFVRSGPEGGGNEKPKEEEEGEEDEDVVFKNGDYVSTPEHSKTRIRQLCREYLEGIVWCIRYYYEGCASWSWFYPHFYAPMAEELARLLTEEDYLAAGGTLVRGEPVRPLEQLLSVLPAQSKALLPASVRPLVEEGSRIEGYYPTEFRLDPNFKSTPWECVAIIPFIDFKKLSAAVEASGAFAGLTPEETRRNQRYGASYSYRYDPRLDPQGSQEGEGKGGESRSRSGGGSGAGAVKATLKNLPDIPRPVSRETAWSFPEEGKRRFIPRPTPGTTEPLPGFPCLRVFKIDSGLDKVGVDIFGRASSKPSLVLSLPGLKKGLSHRRLAEFFLQPSRSCFVGWPYLREARVCGAFDADTVWERSAKKARVGGKTEIIAKAIPGSRRSLFTQASIALAGEFLKKKATRLREVDLLFRVNLFEGMQRFPDGRLVKKFSREETTVPANVVLIKNPRPDPRYAERRGAAAAEEFPPGCAIIFTGSEARLYGCTGRIVAHHSAGKGGKKGGERKGVEEKKAQAATAAASIEVEIDDDVRRVRPPKGSRAKAKAKPKQKPQAQWVDNKFMSAFVHGVIRRLEPKYFSAQKVASTLKMSAFVFSQVTSSVLVKPRNAEIGLQLKSSRHNKMVPGYTRLDPRSGRWEYSMLAVKLVFEYRKRFPRVFLALQRKQQGGKFLDVSDLVARRDKEGYEQVGRGDRKEMDAALREVQGWIKSSQSSSMLAFPATSKVLSKPTILALERATSRLAADSSGSSSEGGEGLPPSSSSPSVSSSSFSRRKVRMRLQAGSEAAYLSLYKATPRTPWSPSSRFAVGERVCCLRGDLGVPVGAKGTVVGVHFNEKDEGEGLMKLDVLFDEKIISGTSLNNMCSQGFGKTLPSHACLNLTTIQKAKLAQTAKVARESGASQIRQGEQGGAWKAIRGEAGGKASVKMPSEATDIQATGLIGTAKKVPRCAGCTRPLPKKDWNAVNANPFCKTCQSIGSKGAAKAAEQAVSKKLPAKQPVGKKVKGVEADKAHTRMSPAIMKLVQKKKQQLQEGNEREETKIPGELEAEPSSGGEKATSKVLSELFAQSKKQQSASNPTNTDSSLPKARLEKPSNFSSGLSPGTIVRLTGFSKKKAEYNGKEGRVVGFKASIDRYVVMLKGSGATEELVALKVRHLIPRSFPVNLPAHPEGGRRTARMPPMPPPGIRQPFHPSAAGLPIPHPLAPSFPPRPNMPVPMPMHPYPPNQRVIPPLIPMIPGPVGMIHRPPMQPPAMMENQPRREPANMPTNISASAKYSAYLQYGSNRKLREDETEDDAGPEIDERDGIDINDNKDVNPHEGINMSLNEFEEALNKLGEEESAEEVISAAPEIEVEDRKDGDEDEYEYEEPNLQLAQGASKMDAIKALLRGHN